MPWVKWVLPHAPSISVTVNGGMRMVGYRAEREDFEPRRSRRTRRGPARFCFAGVFAPDDPSSRIAHSKLYGLVQSRGQLVPFVGVHGLSVASFRRFAVGLESDSLDQVYPFRSRPFNLLHFTPFSFAPLDQPAWYDIPRWVSADVRSNIQCSRYRPHSLEQIDRQEDEQGMLKTVEKSGLWSRSRSIVVFDDTRAHSQLLASRRTIRRNTRE